MTGLGRAHLLSCWHYCCIGFEPWPVNSSVAAAVVRPDTCLFPNNKQMDELSMQTTDRFLEDPSADDEAFCREFLAQRQAFHEASGTFERLRTEVTSTSSR